MPDDTLVDMKLSKSEQKESQDDAVAEADTQKYPYGLQLSFDNESLKKLPNLRKAKFGDVVTILAAGKITRLSGNETETGVDKDVSIQIEKIAINGNPDNEFSAGFESKKD